VGRRFGQLAGALAFALMMGRLGRLLETGPGEPQWSLIFAASAFLGGIAWWLLGQMTTRRAIKLSAFAAAGLLLTFRISAPETLFGGVLPTASTFAAMGEELELAFRIIRSGVPPVSANPGLLAILAVAMWSIGAFFTSGSTGGPYAALFLPSLVMYFQFAVFDRVEAGLGWLTSSALALALSVVAISMERKQETGRARDTEGRPMARRSIHLAAIMSAVLGIGAIAVADNASALISEYGNAPWRGIGGGGYGDGGGGITFNRLVGLQQRILNRSNTPVFVATLGPGAPPANETYWRVESLDHFNGEEWSRSDVSLTQFQPERPLANEYDPYQGTRSDFLQVVRIAELAIDVAPTAGVPIDILAPPDPGTGRRPTDFQVLSDSAIFSPGGLREGDEYQVRTLQPNQTADLGVLATGTDGQLTPMFAAAAAAGDFPHEAAVVDGGAVRPPDLDRYIELPDNTPSNIRNLARTLTARATSDFEAAWVLQSWFRDGDEFTYSTDVDTGHDALVLDDWLTDPTSPNFHTGYCEQFAAAMAVMARTLDIPSRVVWGFTPGGVEIQQNGDELVVVRDTNAHAWVELWMEPYGWVSFDPTPRSDQTPDFESQPASFTAGLAPSEYLPQVTSPENNTTPDIPGGIDEGPEFADPTEPGAASSGARWWLIAIVALIPLAGIIPLVKRIRRRRRLAKVRAGDITAAWDEIVDRLTDLGQDISGSLTPIELALSTDQALLSLAISYSSTVYGGRTGQARESDLYGAEWWIDRTYDGPKRTKAALSLRSLLRRS
jgi:hypothetical protein